MFIQNKTVRFDIKTCLKWLFKFMSTDKKPFCPNTLCCSNLVGIYFC